MKRCSIILKHIEIKIINGPSNISWCFLDAFLNMFSLTTTGPAKDYVLKYMFVGGLLKSF